ncbi:hypothetical protein FS837_003120, partial [Tulasnella sp. UAMH 9824]
MKSDTNVCVCGAGPFSGGQPLALHQKACSVVKQAESKSEVAIAKLAKRLAKKDEARQNAKARKNVPESQPRKASSLMDRIIERVREREEEREWKRDKKRAVLLTSGSARISSGPSVDNLAELHSFREPIPPESSDTPLPHRPSPTPPLPTKSTRRHLPRRFKDFLPQGIASKLSTLRANNTLNEASHNPPSNRPNSTEPGSRTARKWQTPKNLFGLLREYRAWPGPSHIPDDNPLITDLLLPTAEPPVPIPPQSASEVDTSILDAIYPFPNWSIFRFRKHHFDHPINSKQAENDLADLINHPRWRSDDLKGYNRDKLDRLLSTGSTKRLPAKPSLPKANGWVETSVTIDVPLSNGPSTSLPFVVEGFHYRKLTSAIRASLETPSTMEKVHLEPYRLYWSKPGLPSSSMERVYSELYTSDAMIREHEALQRSKPEPGCKLERVVLALLFASDSTHPTNFGQTKVWPLYMAFGNISKYDRCKPSASLMEHIAYFPSMPDHVRDAIQQALGGKAAAKPVITHCNRELMQAFWDILLDSEFVEAWQHGIVVKCSDGVFRRFYPRIFTYSADYPEKYSLVLLATIRNLGNCPCPRCLIEKQDIAKLGTIHDTARRTSNARKDDEARQGRVSAARGLILESGNTVDSVAVERILKIRSEVPTINAFSSKLAPLGFDYFTMLVSDKLHEWDLGEWKAFFEHLIRILYACPGGASLVDELNARFRMVKPFGRDTIRSFYRNVSDMKGFAARDYEDILQCIIPVFEGLLPSPYDGQVLSILYAMAGLASLASLRLHTETTLLALRLAITQYGTLIRRFASVTCTAFETRETPREHQARMRRASAQTSGGGKPAGASRRTFNLQRFKLHAIGDWPASITEFGTLEGYSTWISEMEHRTTKTRYKRTNKTRTSTRQLTAMEGLSRKFKTMSAAVEKILARQATAENPRTPRIVRNPNAPYEIAEDTKHQVPIGPFLRRHDGDPAAHFFWERLRDYLIATIRNEDRATSYTHEERLKLHIQGDALYRHSHLRINYTSYDVRRAQDSLSMRTSRRDIMVAANGSDVTLHPFWYARVLGIFHAMVSFPGDEVGELKRVDLLWVRWFQIERHRPKRRQDRLEKLAFAPLESEMAFGFIHPSEVIRACHLIPAFAEGYDLSTVGHSYVQDAEGDYKHYYIMKFVDRDMYMRYHGGGVGHLDPNTRVTEAAPTGDGDPSDIDFSATTRSESAIDETETGENDVDDNISQYSEEEDFLPLSGSESDGEGSDRDRDSEADYSASEDGDSD